MFGRSGDVGQKESKRSGKIREFAPSMRAIVTVAVILSFLLAIVVLYTMQEALKTYGKSGEKSAAYDQCQRATQDLMDASDYLTEQVRQFVNSGDRQYMDGYLAELQTYRRRENAVEELRKAASSEEATAALEEAVRYSDDLSRVEMRAMRLAADSYGTLSIPEPFAQVELSPEESSLSPEQKRTLAHDLVFGDEYTSRKLAIRERVQSSSSLLVGSLREDLLRIDAQLSVYLTSMRVSVILLLSAILFLTVAINYLLLRPIALHEKSIRKGEPLTPDGARELRYLTTTYNTMYEKNYIQTQNLQHEAKTDALTGVLNRAHYDRMLEMHRHDSALILVDIDNFKSFNDDYGHEMGDAVLVEVAATLFGTFRQSDFICRIGGDEFAIIMTQMKPEFREVIERKLEKVTAFLRDTSNGLPPVTLSVGIAFGDESSTPESIFEAADSALYKVKDAGRNGYRFAE